MKTKMVLTSGLCLVCIFTAGLLSVNADVKKGTSWQTAEYVNIPLKEVQSIIFLTDLRKLQLA